MTHRDKHRKILHSSLIWKIVFPATSRVKKRSRIKLLFQRSVKMKHSAHLLTLLKQIMVQLRDLAKNIEPSLLPQVANSSTI